MQAMCEALEESLANAEDAGAAALKAVSCSQEKSMRRALLSKTGFEGRSKGEGERGGLRLAHILSSYYSVL